MHRLSLATTISLGVVVATTATALLAADKAAIPQQSVVVYTRDHPPASPSLGDLPLHTNVSQYGITWTFDKPVHVGQFVNGDYYVVGPFTIVDINPRPLWGDEVGSLIDRDSVQESKYPGKQARNGSSLNPPAKSKEGGFDSRIPSGRYDPRLFTHLPIPMKPGDSLVSTISRQNNEITKFGGQFVDPLRVAAALTCLGEPQPPDAFRPSFCDSVNSGTHLARNLHRDLLLQMPRCAGAPANLKSYIEAFRKPWLDIVEFGFAAPVENLPHYGEMMAEVEGEGSLLLLMDYPAEDKERLLINLAQVGIDLMGIGRADGSWPAHGGLHSGRKWPIVFAGVMLDDQKMKSPTQTCPKLHFGEDDQTALCPYEYKGKVYDRGWTGAKAIFTGHSLLGTGGDRGNWERGAGPVDLFPPSEWPLKERGGLPSSESYRRANTSPAWVGQALAVRMMHLERAWNHDAFFAYVDRWMSEDDRPFLPKIKEAGFTDITKVQDGKFLRQAYVTGVGREIVLQMWKTYRNHLPPARDGHKDPPMEQTWK